MNAYKVLKYSETHSDAWNNFVAQSKNGTFLFQRDFMDYHQDRFEDFSLIVFNDKNIVALMPANKVGNTIYSHQGLTYGGLLVSQNVTFETVLNSFKVVLSFLNDHNIAQLQLKLAPKIYHTLPSDEIDYLLFIVEAELYRRDVTSTISNFNRLKITSTNRKRQLKKAQLNQIRVEEVPHFSDFWNTILIPNLELKHQVLPVHSLAEITNLKQHFPNNIRQFNAYHKSQIIAGVTIFETKTVAHAQYISTIDEVKDFGGLDAIFDYLLRTFYKDKPYFDFGISNENNGKNINQGLQYWKEGFGARTIIHDFYSIKTSNRHKLENVFK